MNITIRLRGFKEAQAKFRALQSGQESILDPAVRAGALIIENAAKGFAPKRTGTLARSITSERSS